MSSPVENINKRRFWRFFDSSTLLTKPFFFFFWIFENKYRGDGNLKVAIYTRVSTDDQNPETQRQMIEDYCNRIADYEIFDKYEDVITGKTDSRPEFNRFLDDMRKGKFNAIAVYKLDRIGRSLQHLLQLFEEFNNKGIEFISITQNINTSSPEGRLMLKMLMLLAEYERELIVSRIRDTLNRYKNQIKKHGHFTSRKGKRIKKLGRPKGSKDGEPRRKSGYYRRWERKKSKQI